VTTASGYVCRGGGCDLVVSVVNMDTGTRRGVVCFGVGRGEGGFLPMVGGFGVGVFVTLGGAGAHTVEDIFSSGVCHFGVIVLVRS
jgi:hypothetical protein